MFCKYLIKLLRSGMEGKAYVLYQALGLLFLYEAPQVKIIKIFCPVLSKIMEQIEIKISGSRLLKGSLELSDGLFPGLAVYPGCVLGRKLEALPRISLHEGLPYGVLAARIGPGRIKISKACRKELVHHDLDLLNVYLSILFRQTHESKAKLSDIFSQISHIYLHILNVN